MEPQDRDRVLELTVVTVPDCPNAPVLEERLARVLAELQAVLRAGSVVRAAGVRVSISRQVVTDAEQAARWQMRGSPTLLIEGTDPFAAPSTPAGLACRMYRDERGRAQGAPSVAALQQVLGPALQLAAGRTTGETAGATAGRMAAPGGLARWEAAPVWPDPLTRAEVGRLAPVEGGLRAVH
ncbi:hypothetical protein ACWDRB_62330 [Nonomuraea sp. NPDC003707]